jgi:hypothetical protein
MSQGVLQGVAYVPEASLAAEGVVVTQDSSMSVPPLLPTSTQSTIGGDASDSASVVTAVPPPASPGFTTYVVDAINDNPAMLACLRLVDTMQAKFGADWGVALGDMEDGSTIQPATTAMPAWMDAIMTHLRASDSTMHSRLFILKVSGFCWIVSSSLRHVGCHSLFCNARECLARGRSTGFRPFLRCVRGFSKTNHTRSPRSFTTSSVTRAS